MRQISPLETGASIVSRPIKRFLADESGTTAIEYAMVASGVALCIIATVQSLGSTLKTTFYGKLAAMFP